MARAFIKSWGAILAKRSVVFVLVNMLCFGCVFAAVLWAQFQFLLPHEGVPVEVPGFLVGLDWPVLVVAIFLFNLVLSGFVVVTLPGLVFFPLSVATLLFRAFLWGVLLSRLPTPQFLAVLPTLVLEGEGYVVASVAGMMLGLSWLKPGWVFRGESLSRWESFKRALGECSRLYLLVALILFVAAAVETFTILSLTT